MKYAALKIAIAGLLFMGTTVAVKAQETGCTDATLKGNYAFTVSGEIFLTTPDGMVITVQRQGVAMTHFDGVGGLTQEDYVLSSPNAPAPKMPPPAPPTDPVTGFHDGEKGKYTVFPNCTGTFTIDTPASSPVVTVNFVLADGGASIHTIVTSLVLPGYGAATALIHSDGHRLGRIREWWE
jgi:hypothetical protein